MGFSRQEYWSDHTLFFFFSSVSCLVPFGMSQKAVRIETFSTFLVKQKSSHSGVQLVRSEGASSRMTKRPEARLSQTGSQGTTFAYSSINLESESHIDSTWFFHACVCFGVGLCGSVYVFIHILNSCTEKQYLSCTKLKTSEDTINDAVKILLLCFPGAPERTSITVSFVSFQRCYSPAPLPGSSFSFQSQWLYFGQLCVNWESSADIRTPPCVKWRASGKLLCSPGSWAGCWVVTEGSGTRGSEAYQGRDTCIRRTDPHCSRAEADTAL